MLDACDGDDNDNDCDDNDGNDNGDDDNDDDDDDDDNDNDNDDDDDGGQEDACDGDEGAICTGRRWMKYYAGPNNKPECISNGTHCKRPPLIKAVTRRHAEINDTGID